MCRVLTTDRPRHQAGGAKARQRKETRIPLRESSGEAGEASSGPASSRRKRQKVKSQGTGVKRDHSTDG